MRDSGSGAGESNDMALALGAGRELKGGDGGAALESVNAVSDTFRVSIGRLGDDDLRKTIGEPGDERKRVRNGGSVAQLVDDDLLGDAPDLKTSGGNGGILERG
jgi:hypothetical protein